MKAILEHAVLAAAIFAIGYGCGVIVVLRVTGGGM